MLDIDHIQLAAPRGCEAQARRFFGEVLGLPEIAKPDALRSRGGCWFQVGTKQLHIGVEEAFRPARKAHPAFLVSNPQAVFAALERAGARCAWDETLGNTKRFYADDPWGNRLEFTGAQDYILRPPRAGDLGWVAQRHGELYARDEGYDMGFEALVAHVVAGFYERKDTERERGWIAERAGERIGCVFVCRKSERVAKLRMLLVEPSARGLGLGTRLIDECIRFARAAGYRKMVLWTHKSLTSARRLYKKAGFKLVKAEPNPSFGRKLVDEFWEIKL